MRPDTPPGKRDQLVKLAKHLLAGAQLKLLSSKGILNYWTLTGQPPSDSKTDPDANWDDYSTGSGVFWRYMLRVWQTNPDLKEALDTSDFQKILRTNADEAMKDPAGPRNWPNATSRVSSGSRSPTTSPCWLRPTKC
jgi:hypothetical protein